MNVTLKHDISRKIAEEVISARIDIGIAINPVRHPDLVIHRLCEDDFTAWTAAGGGGKKNGNILICDPDLGQSQALIKRMARSGRVFDRVVASGSLEVVADLAAAGCGMGLLPARVAGLARRKLRRLAGAPVLHDTCCLLYRVENKNVKSIQALSAAIKGIFSPA